MVVFVNEICLSNLIKAKRALLIYVEGVQSNILYEKLESNDNFLPMGGSILDKDDFSQEAKKLLSIKVNPNGFGIKLIYRTVVKLSVLSLHVMKFNKFSSNEDEKQVVSKSIDDILSYLKNSF